MQARDHSQKEQSHKLVGFTVLAVSAWQLCLLLLFNFDPQSFLLAAITGVAIATCSGLLVLYFSEKPIRYQGTVLVLVLAWYLQIITLPHDQFEARPADEFRAAGTLLVNPDNVRADFLFQRPRAPFAVATAAVHKYRDDLPDFSWYIRFSDQPAETGNLINIRNEMAASTHPSFSNARIFEQYLIFEVEQYGTQVIYTIPLDKSALPFTAYGSPAGSNSDYHYFTAEVYPHILSPAQQSRFHLLFFRLLNLRLRS